MNKDILDLISTIESDTDTLNDISISFEDEYEIEYTHNNFELWIYSKSENRWIYGGIYDNICEDLLNFDGIIVDGQIHKFKYFEFIPE